MRTIGLFLIICLFTFNDLLAGIYLLEDMLSIDIDELIASYSDSSSDELAAMIVFITLIQSILLTVIAVGILHKKETKDIILVNQPATSTASTQEDLNKIKIRELERQVEEMRRQQEHIRYMPPRIEHRD